MRVGGMASRGEGERAPPPGRNDGLETLPRELGAEGIAVIGPVRDQTGQGRAPIQASIRAQAWVLSRCWPRHVQAQGGGPVDPQDISLGAEAASAATSAGSVFFLGRAPAALTCARTYCAVPSSTADTESACI